MHEITVCEQGKKNGQNLDTKHNGLWCGGREQKKHAHQTYHLCTQQEQKYTGCTELTFMIAMDDNNEWLANNKTWKK